MAGSNPAFDPTVFRDNIRAAMRMGMPDDTDKRLTWHWDRERSFTVEDPAGEPYDWTDDPVTDEPGNPQAPSGSLQVDYALEFAARPAGSRDTPVGQIDTSRATITLLDEDFEKIETADHCTIDGDRYDIDFQAPPMGMFEVTVHTVFLTARDET